MKLMSCLLLSLVLLAPAYGKSYVNKTSEKERTNILLNSRYNKYINYVYLASLKTGLEMDEIAAFMKVESTFDEKAYNSEYKASGLFQHIPSTWRKQKKLYGPEMGVSAKADVFNPKASIYIGTAALAAEKKQLALDTNRHVKEIKSGELYLTHLYGYDKAMKIINAPDNAHITRYVKANKNTGLIFYNKGKPLTTKEFIHNVNEKMEKEKSIFKNKSNDYQLTMLISTLSSVKQSFLVALT